GRAGADRRAVRRGFWRLRWQRRGNHAGDDRTGPWADAGALPAIGDLRRRADRPARQRGAEGGAAATGRGRLAATGRRPRRAAEPLQAQRRADRRRGGRRWLSAERAQGGGDRWAQRWRDHRFGAYVRW